MFLDLLNNTFFNQFLCENTHKFDDISDFFGEKKIHNVLRNILVCITGMLFRKDAHQISFNSAEKWPRKWYRNMTCSYEIHGGEKRI